MKKLAQNDNMRSSHRTQGGFSLLELVVAVSIMLILGVVGFVAYQGYTDNARQATVDSAAQEVLTATIAADDSPGQHAVQALKEYNRYSDRVLVNITEASTEGLEITAVDDGTYGTARVAGDYSHLSLTQFSRPGYTFEWAGERHNSVSHQYVFGELRGTNLVRNPRFADNGRGWVARERDRITFIEANPVQVISSDGHFSAMQGHPAIGDKILHITRRDVENASGSIFAHVEPEYMPNIEGYSHIAYGAPIQGRGKMWMYFRPENNPNARVGYIEEDTEIHENGGWITGGGEIPEGAVIADLYLGSAYESSKPEGDRFVNEVHYGSPIIAVGHSQAEVDAIVQEYFDGDSW